MVGGGDGGAFGTSAGGRGGPSSRKIEPNCANAGTAVSSAAIVSRQIERRDRAISRFSAWETAGLSRRPRQRPVNTLNTAAEGQRRTRCLAPAVGAPRLVIAGRLRTSAGGQRRTRRPQRAGRAGHIGPVRFLPRMRLVGFLRGRSVDSVVDPAVPGGRDGRGFGVAIINHPAPLEAKCRVDLAAAGAKIAIAEFVLADAFAIHPGPELGAEGLRIPPGEQPKQETFHRRRAFTIVEDAAFCHLAAAMSSAHDYRAALIAVVFIDIRPAWIQSGTFDHHQ